MRSTTLSLSLSLSLSHTHTHTHTHTVCTACTSQCLIEQKHTQSALDTSGHKAMIANFIYYRPGISPGSIHNRCHTHAHAGTAAQATRTYFCRSPNIASKQSTSNTTSMHLSPKETHPAQTSAVCICCISVVSFTTIQWKCDREHPPDSRLNLKCVPHVSDKSTAKHHVRVQ